MSTYALITDAGALVRMQEFDGAAPVLAPEKALRWIPFVEVTASPGPLQVMDGHTDALESGEWVRRQRVRDMTAVELLDAVMQARAGEYVAQTLAYKGLGGGVIDAIGHWLDAVAAELVARGPVVTAEFQALLDIRSAVKASHPKPGN